MSKMNTRSKKDTKKKQALDAQEKTDEEILNRGIACVREYLRHAEMDFWEKDIDGSLFFTGVYCTEESALSMFRWVVGVDSDVVGIVCCIPLRVPKPRLDAVVAFVNKVNAEHACAGSLAVDPDCGEITFRYDMPTAALKGDPESALDDFFTQAFGAAIGYLDPILEVVMGAELPAEECKDGLDGEAKSTENDDGKPAGTDRETKGPMAPTAKLAPDYSLDGLGIESDVPLDRLVAAVCRFRKTGRSSEAVPRLSILLSGPSGCGKSEFVKYLGERAGMEVVTATASSILRSLVGETEQRIAEAFKDAAEKKAILFLDEVDSLLYDRKYAHYGWERVQTNELLQQMERFTGVLVCATNLIEQLDSAVMRRFTFKVKMSALDDDGKVKFFNRYFKTGLTADERRRLVSIPDLTPGDFRTVRERSYFLGRKRGSGNAQLLSALEVESTAKKERRAPIGFA